MGGGLTKFSPAGGTPQAPPGKNPGSAIDSYQHANLASLCVLFVKENFHWTIIVPMNFTDQYQTSCLVFQCLPQADSLSAPYDNQGMVERPIQPRFMGTPQGSFPGPPPYPPGADTEQWKLPKYEELDNAQQAPNSSFLGQPPPYAPPAQTGNPGMFVAVLNVQVKFNFLWLVYFNVKETYYLTENKRWGGIAKYHIIQCYWLEHPGLEISNFEGAHFKAYHRTNVNIKAKILRTTWYTM